MSTVTQEPQQQPSPPEPAFSAESGETSLRSAVIGYGQRIRGGDVGSLPAVAGLIVLVIVFASLKEKTFYGAANISDLINQSAPVIVIAMGLVFVLLLGEIDLSAGFTGGTAAAVVGVYMTNHGWAWPLALAVGLITGIVIGSCIGWLVAYLGIPSFVVTLAAYLGLQGVLLLVVGDGGSIRYDPQGVIRAVESKNMPVWLGIVLFVVVAVAYTGITFRRSVVRRAAGLAGDPLSVWAAKTGAIVIILAAATYYLSVQRSRNDVVSIKGIPIVVAVVGVLLLLLTFVLSRTSWGRHVYAVGGNAEAARRAGINVRTVKLSCFIICSTMAAVGGVLLASQVSSVNPNTGGDETLLYAVGAAVIGGTSLFGGKGRVLDAVIGGLVVGVISNGMTLLKQPPGRVFIITGLVLLIAASVDALSRRRAAASGRA